MAKTFWLSWYEPRERHTEFEYHGPWWISGETTDGKHRTICAAVMAPDEEAAKCVIYTAYDNPEAHGVDTWRFANERADDWSPFSDRFPQADWMKWPFPGEDGKPRPEAG